VIASEPALAVELAAGQLDRAMEAIADFMDLKSPFMPGHSVAVARLAEEAGHRLRLPPNQVMTLRRAGSCTVSGGSGCRIRPGIGTAR
jgi:HD-GYP domain-containing protein (c-di-GMP phosphodiesterase class II)